MLPTAATSPIARSASGGLPSTIGMVGGHVLWPEYIGLCLTETLLGFAVACAALAASPSAAATHAPLLAASLAFASALVSAISGYYQPKMLLRSSNLLVGTAITTFGLGIVLMPLIGWVAPGALEKGSWSYLINALLLFTLALLAVRLGFSNLLRRGVFRRRIAVLRGGSEPVLVGPNGDLTFDFVPFDLQSAEISAADLRSARIWGVVAENAALQASLQDLQKECRQAGVHLLSAAELEECRFGRVDLHALPANWLATMEGSRENAATAALHRSFDVIAALALLLMTLPLLVVTALAIRLDSRGPVFYRQERVGRGGRVFTLFKFRSMVVDAEVGGKPRWATERDPRVTRVGRFIRLTRIDEIPQVLNVLRGDMAFVGPRPERPAFVEQLGQIIPHYHAREVVKPGITGWAQVNYPYGASVEDARMKLAYDLCYIRRRSLLLDGLIVLATIRVVVFQKGAR